jgi:hypothetical protein
VSHIRGGRTIFIDAMVHDATMWRFKENDTRVKILVNHFTVMTQT